MGRVFALCILFTACSHGSLSPPLEATPDLAPPCGPALTLCQDGCVALASDEHHCGSCDVDCDNLPHTGAAWCSAGACHVVLCAGGFGDCNDDPSDGCEADLTSADHCGYCSLSCSGAKPVCQQSACVSGCASGSVRCGGACVDTAGDVGNCGACGQACPIPAHGSALCAAGKCGVVCAPGWFTCGAACCFAWSSTPIDPVIGGGRFEKADFAVDAGDNEHIVWINDSLHELLYARHQGSTLTLERAVTSLDYAVIDSLRIALDGSGQPWVSWGARSGTTTQGHVAWRDGGGWHDELLDGVYNMDLAVTPGGQVHVAGFIGGHLRHGLRTGPGAYTWDDVAPGTVGIVKIAVTAAGVPWLVYNSSANWQQDYVATPGASGWTSTVLPANNGPSPLLTLDPMDHPYVTLYDHESHDVYGFWESLALADHCFGPIRFDPNPVCTTMPYVGPGYQLEVQRFTDKWAVTSAVAMPNLQALFDTQVDSSHQLRHLVDDDRALKVLAGGATTIVDRERNPGGGLRVLTDAGGIVHMIYGDAVTSELHYRTSAGLDEVLAAPAYQGDLALDASGFAHACVWSQGAVSLMDRTSGSWQSETIPGAAGACALALDASGDPHVVAGATYYRKTSGAWESFTVDSGAGSGALALDGGGTPLIIYRNGQGELTAAHFVGTRFALQDLGVKGVVLGHRLAFDAAGTAHFALVASSMVQEATLSGVTFQSQIIGAGEAAELILVAGTPTIAWASSSGSGVAQKTSGGWSLTPVSGTPPYFSELDLASVGGKLRLFGHDYNGQRLLELDEP